MLEKPPRRQTATDPTLSLAQHAAPREPKKGKFGRSRAPAQRAARSASDRPQASQAEFAIALAGQKRVTRPIGNVRHPHVARRIDDPVRRRANERFVNPPGNVRMANITDGTNNTFWPADAIAKLAWEDCGRSDAAGRHLGGAARERPNCLFWGPAGRRVVPMITSVRCCLPAGWFFEHTSGRAQLCVLRCLGAVRQRKLGSRPGRGHIVVTPRRDRIFSIRSCTGWTMVLRSAFSEGSLMRWSFLLAAWLAMSGSHRCADIQSWCRSRRKGELWR